MRKYKVHGPWDRMDAKLDPELHRLHTTIFKLTTTRSRRAKMMSGDSWGHALATKDDRRLSLVRRARELPIAALLRNPDRHGILRIDQAHRPRRCEVCIAPADRRADGLRAEALALRPGRQCPADLRRAGEGGRDLPLEVGEPDLA